MTKEVLKDYSNYFEPIMELPESGYCYLEHDMFHVTRQYLIQEFLFKNGYDWTRTTSDSKRMHEWNHAWSIVWRTVKADPSIGLDEYLDLSWSFDSIIIWDEPYEKDREVKRYLFDELFAPKKQYEGFISGLTYNI
jgi:hypothetical protein